MTAAQIQQQLVAQLDEVLLEFQRLKDQTPRSQWHEVPREDMMHFVTRARAAIHRVAGRHSTYAEQCEEMIRQENLSWRKAPLLAGIISSLRSDIEAGYLHSYTEIVHGELFADFLEMSQHLLDQGYKDAAAVIAGSSLEAHLRQLCQKAGVETETETGSLKKADRLNNELAAANVYSKLDQKNVTAWLDLRNKAAHGHYDQYQGEQVAVLILGVRDFITRNPA